MYESTIMPQRGMGWQQEGSPRFLQELLFTQNLLPAGATGPAVKSDSPSAPSIAPLSDGVSASSLLTTASQHATALGALSHAEELPSTTSAQLSR